MARSPRTNPSDPIALRERQVQMIAAATLACIMAGHLLLETGRDALFLAHVSVERLPFATIAIALLALLASLGPVGRANRVVLLALQAIAAIGTLGFWVLVAAGQAWSYYALYVWSGVITSVVVVRFWLVLGDLFTITEGKRLFATIAMGGSVGALVGSFAAAAIAPRLGGEGLLLAATTEFVLSAVGPALSFALWPRPLASTGEATPTETGTRLAEAMRGVFHDRYASRIAITVIAGGITITLGDYLFKSVLAEEVASQDLATILSRIYLGLNVLSIGMLAVGVTPLVSRLGVDRSLAVLPSLIGIAAIGILGGGALGAIIALKVADGTLRYSLHKTASELLYLPMSSRMRESVKGAIDIVGQTAGKALASLVVLGLVLLPEPRMMVAGAVVASASLWVVCALRIRGSYLDVFRQTLRDGTIETEIDYPELDLDSATALVSALSEPEERRVLAAMRTLAERGHVALIPSLILYHPSPNVVVQALDIFSRTGRDGLVPLLGHLVDHEDGNVRAAAVRASWALTSDIHLLEGLRKSDCAAVRVSAVAGLLAAGEANENEYRDVLDVAMEYETYEPRLAAGLAAQLFYHEASREALLRMAADDDARVAIESVRAIDASGDAWFTSRLVGLLGDRRVREDVRKALIARGEEALKVLSESLLDPSMGAAVSRHIPRTIARFGSARAAEILMESLSSLESGTVRYKVLRGLETLRDASGHDYAVDSEIARVIDARRLGDEYDRVLDQCMERLELESELARAQHADAGLATPSGVLLVELLRDKRELAVGRLFRLLGLMRPLEDFGVIRAGLESDRAKDRASARELLESLLPRERSQPLLRLCEGLDWHAIRVEASPAAPREDAVAYADILHDLARSQSRTLQAVALYHAGERGIERDGLGRPLGSEGAEDASADSGEALQDRALASLRELSLRSGRRTRPVRTALFAR